MDVDVEKSAVPSKTELATIGAALPVDDERSQSRSDLEKDQGQPQSRKRWYRALLSFLEIETHGVEPVPREQRTDKRLYEMFFVWFSANLNVLAFSTGSVGPTVFGLGIKESFTVIVLVDLISFLIPAFFGIFGPKLGMRTMVQARYSFGYYGSILPSALNVFTLQGFLVLNSIIGGQTLAAVSDTLSWNVGIVIIAIMSLFVTFCGYRVVHWYESVAWIPNVVTFITMLAIGGKLLSLAPLTGTFTPGAGGVGGSVSVASVVSFATTLASTDVSWCTMVADYGVYHDANASSWRIFIYTYLGFFVSSVTMHLIGAAFACAAPFVPSWNAGYQNGSDIGGLMAAVLSDSDSSAMRGFGKFLTVLVALSVPSACAPTMYSFGTSAMNVTALDIPLVPAFVRKIPRNVYAIVSFGILIPLAIIGAKDFYSTFVDLFSIIGYWTASFSGIILAEQLVQYVLSLSPSSSSSHTPADAQSLADAASSSSFWTLAYPPSWYASRARLPPAWPATLAFLASLGAVVPFMSQAWYTGPVALQRGTGDLGVIIAGGGAGVLYVVLRTFWKSGICGGKERMWKGRK